MSGIWHFCGYVFSWHYSPDWTPSLGNSICSVYSPVKEKQTYHNIIAIIPVLFNISLLLIYCIQSILCIFIQYPINFPISLPSTNSTVLEKMKKRELLCTVGENVNWCSLLHTLWKTMEVFLPKLKMELWAILLPGIYFFVFNGNILTKGCAALLISCHSVR